MKAILILEGIVGAWMVRVGEGRSKDIRCPRALAKGTEELGHVHHANRREEARCVLKSSPNLVHVVVPS